MMNQAVSKNGIESTTERIKSLLNAKKHRLEKKYLIAIAKFIKVFRFKCKNFLLLLCFFFPYEGLPFLTEDLIVFVRFLLTYY